MILPAFEVLFGTMANTCRTFIPISTIQINKKDLRWYQIMYELLFPFDDQKGP